MKYQEKLKDPRWQKKRLEVLEADGWKCVNCGGGSKTLHAHHLLYRDGKEPWEYHTGSIVTLCEGCHKMTHNDPMKTLARNMVDEILRTANGIECAQFVQDVSRWESDFKKKVAKRMKTFTAKPIKKYEVTP